MQCGQAMIEICKREAGHIIVLLTNTVVHDLFCVALIN
jgi:hypothetical protein